MRASCFTPAPLPQHSGVERALVSITISRNYAARQHLSLTLFDRRIRLQLFPLQTDSKRSRNEQYLEARQYQSKSNRLTQ